MPFAIMRAVVVLPFRANTRHDKCLRNAISGKGIFKGAHHRVLTDQIGKGFWSYFRART